MADCDQFLAQCAAGLNGRRPIGRAHMGKLRRRLIAILRNDRRTGHLPRNVAELTILPGAEDQGDDEEQVDESRRSLTVDELHRLLDAAKGSRLILIDLAAATVFGQPKLGRSAGSTST